MGHASRVLVLGRGEGESIIVGNNIKITVVEVVGDLVRIGIEAPHDVAVHREEIYLQIERANRDAATSTSELDDP